MTKLTFLWRAARWVVPALVLVAAGLAVPTPASAARVWIGVGVGVPVWGGYYYPPYYGYYGYPYYPYAYPQSYYAPPAAQPAPSGSSNTSTQNCRDYSSTQTIDGQQQTVTGTACRQPDGSWRIVR